MYFFQEYAITYLSFIESKKLLLEWENFAATIVMTPLHTPHTHHTTYYTTSTKELHTPKPAFDDWSHSSSTWLINPSTENCLFTFWNTLAFLCFHKRQLINITRLSKQCFSFLLICARADSHPDCRMSSCSRCHQDPWGEPASSPWIWRPDPQTATKVGRIYLQRARQPAKFNGQERNPGYQGSLLLLPTTPVKRNIRLRKRNTTFLPHDQKRSRVVLVRVINLPPAAVDHCSCRSGNGENKYYSGKQGKMYRQFDTVRST
jgi:hypothetical protein